jgi:hypothetical protein
VNTNQVSEHYRHAPQIGFFFFLTAEKKKEHLFIIGFNMSLAAIANTIAGRSGPFLVFSLLLIVICASSYHLYELIAKKKCYLTKPPILFLIAGISSFTIVFIISVCALLISMLP